MVNHYREACEILQKNGGELKIIKEELGLTDVDFEIFLEMEKQYFNSLHWPSCEVSLQNQYIQALNNFADAQ